MKLSFDEDQADQVHGTRGAGFVALGIFALPALAYFYAIARNFEWLLD